MTRISIVFSGLATAMTSCADTPEPLPQTLSLPDNYSLVWADEFETDGLPDPTKWGYDTERNAEGWYNEELQYYSAARSENARVENGRLIIEARKELLPADQFPDTGGQSYTSARLFTENIVAWKYGYFEIRAKLPCGRGLWPAIWTLPNGAFTWPDDGEIDIMEYVGWDANQFHATVHTRDNNHTRDNEYSATYTTDTACGEFHTHSLLWTEDDILIAVDGTPYFRYPKGDRGFGEWPFDRAHFLLLNVAIGGWGGQQGIDDTVFPARMEVDYVRVYQKADAS
ncbi:MAG: glycoside hydrolase family 16 protein [Pseudomonadota bacterium]